MRVDSTPIIDEFNDLTEEQEERLRLRVIELGTGFGEVKHIHSKLPNGFVICLGTEEGRPFGVLLKEEDDYPLGYYYIGSGGLTKKNEAGIRASHSTVSGIRREHFTEEELVDLVRVYKSFSIRTYGRVV